MMNISITKASKAEVGRVLDLMLSGLSSDPVSVDEMNRSWWRRIFFRRYFGPRLLGSQMDTFIARRADEGDDLVGYLVVQYEGDVAGTFDWALTEPLTDETAEILADLIDRALDHVQETSSAPYFYFGLLADSPPVVTNVLEELGFWLADYQLVQMRGRLSPEASATLPDNVFLRPQISARFAAKMEELLPYDYGLTLADLAAEETEDVLSTTEDGSTITLVDQVAALLELHKATLSASKIFVVEDEGEAVGFVQQFRWRAELRLLLSLHQDWWGTDRERQLVAALPGYLGRRNETVRVRTFSRMHLEASRASLEQLGLAWEPAPWHRWLVGL